MSFRTNDKSLWYLAQWYLVQFWYFVQFLVFCTKIVENTRIIPKIPLLLHFGTRNAWYRMGYSSGHHLGQIKSRTGFAQWDSNVIIQGKLTIFSV